MAIKLFVKCGDIKNLNLLGMSGGRGRDRTYDQSIKSRTCLCAIPQCSCGTLSCETVSVTKSVTSFRKRNAVGVALIDRDDQLIGFLMLVGGH
jgi:hypothetical protein